MVQVLPFTISTPIRTSLCSGSSQLSCRQTAHANALRQASAAVAGHCPANTAAGSGTHQPGNQVTRKLSEAA